MVRGSQRDIEVVTVTFNMDDGSEVAVTFNMGDGSEVTDPWCLGMVRCGRMGWGVVGVVGWDGVCWGEVWRGVVRVDVS